MKELKTLVSDSSKRPTIVRDCVHLIEEEVQSKGGLTGIAVKTAYKVVKAVKPTMIENAVDGLLDDFVDKLQPYFAEWQIAGASGTLEAFFRGKSDRIAESLLKITDDRAAKSTHKTLVSAYNTLRPKGKEHVVAAVPGIGRTLDRHVKSL